MAKPNPADIKAVADYMAHPDTDWSLEQLLSFTDSFNRIGTPLPDSIREKAAAKYTETLPPGWVAFVEQRPDGLRFGAILAKSGASPRDFDMRDGS